LTNISLSQQLAVADEPARTAASRQTFCKQRWKFNVIILTYPTCIWRLRMGVVTPFEFCRDLRHQKTRVPELSSGVVLRDHTFSRFSRTSTCDRQTYRHTITAYTALAWCCAVKTVQDRDIVTMEGYRMIRTRSIECCYFLGL